MTDPDEIKVSTLSNRVLDAIVSDLYSRSGFQEAWKAADSGVQQDMLDAWRAALAPLADEVEALRGRGPQDLDSARVLPPTTRENRDLVEELRGELAEYRDALTRIHRHTGRGDGHGSPDATAACVISAFVSAGMAIGEVEQEARAAHSQIVETTGELLRRADVIIASLLLGKRDEDEIESWIFDSRAAINAVIDETEREPS